MNKSFKVLLYVLLVASLGANAYLLALARWNHERIESFSEHVILNRAAAKIKPGLDKVSVYKLIERLPDSTRPTDSGTTVESWIPDDHKPFLHRMRFGNDAANGSYYLYIEFDVNDTVVEVSSGNF